MDIDFKMCFCGHFGESHRRDTLVCFVQGCDCEFFTPARKTDSDPPRDEKTEGR